MKPGIDPKVDYAFKKVFGSESNVDLLKDLIEAVLGMPSGNLTAIELLNPFNDKDAWDDKLSVLDIKAREASGRWFNIEMQMLAHVALRERVLYYWARVYASQLTDGAGYEKLRPTVSICFLNARLFPKPDVYRHRFALVDRAAGEVLSDQLDIHFVELPKFTLVADDLTTSMEKWCYFLRYGESLDSEQLPTTLDNAVIHKAMEVLNVITQNERDRARYDSRHIGELDERQRRKDRQDEIDRAVAAAVEAAVATAVEAAVATAVEKTKGLTTLVQQIRMLQLFLKQPQTPVEELEQRSANDLVTLAAELESLAFPPS